MPARSARRNRGPADAARRKRPWWRRWWMLLLIFPGIVLGAFGLLAAYFVFSSVPLPEDIVPTASTVLDVDGEEAGVLSEAANQEIIEFRDIPARTRLAVMAAEDRGFYSHRGISVTGIARALFTNVRAGQITQGGSTITQQYIKNAALSHEQTYTRKVQEAALALKLEQRYSKDEILGFYLNAIYWGRGTIGIEAASQAYYGHPASELDLNQSAVLAGIIASPENYDPAENPEAADRRRRFVLAGMLEEGWIDQATHDETVAAGLPDVLERRLHDPGPNGYYLDAVRRILAAQPEFQGNELFRGLRVHTGLDQRMQAAAQEELTRAVEEGPTDSGAIVSVDSLSGEVRALVGGTGVQGQAFNTAIRGPRQAGSTFKAFTLQAFTEHGNSPETRFPAPATIEVDDEHQDATISNFGGSSFGEQSVYQATASSTNTVYYQMQEAVGRETVIDAARRAGLPATKDEEVYPTDRGADDGMRPFGSLTLGVDGFTPLELASAYATYAAEGLHTTPHLVTRVEDANGVVLWEPDVTEREAVELNVARVVTSALERVVTSGSGTAAAIGRPVAGKTGTTQDSRDAWFIGYVPQLSTAVWLGNRDNTPIEGDATGGRIAAPLWGAYMTRAVEGLQVEDFVAPDLTALGGGQPEGQRCPDGYEFAVPPNEVDEDGFFPDVLIDIIDDEGRPCVEIKPEPAPQCPDGYAFADPPGPDADPRPDVLTDIVDANGRPCVELNPQPDPPDPDPGTDGGADDDGDDDGDGADDGDDGTDGTDGTDDGGGDDGTDGTTDDGGGDGDDGGADGTDGTDGAAQGAGTTTDAQG